MGKTDQLAQQLAAAREVMFDQGAEILIDPRAPADAKAIARYFLTADKDPDKPMVRLKAELCGARLFNADDEEE